MSMAYRILATILLAIFGATWLSFVVLAYGGATLEAWQCRGTAGLFCGWTAFFGAASLTMIFVGGSVAGLATLLYLIWKRGA